MERNETPTGLAPSADTPAEKRRKVRIGKGFVVLICAFALAAFALYTFIVVYGIISSGN